MTESVESTYEEATRCPKCRKPGEVTRKDKTGKQSRLPKGTMVHTVYCRNQICPWLDTCWLVQVNKDGTVPPPTNHKGQAKIYPTERFKDHDEMAKRVVDALHQELDRSTDFDKLGRTPGQAHEIPNPGAR
jgi:hypothetical protein